MLVSVIEKNRLSRQILLPEERNQSCSNRFFPLIDGRGEKTKQQENTEGHFVVRWPNDSITSADDGKLCILSAEIAKFSWSTTTSGNTCSKAAGKGKKATVTSDIQKKVLIFLDAQINKRVTEVLMGLCKNGGERYSNSHSVMEITKQLVDNPVFQLNFSQNAMVVRIKLAVVILLLSCWKKSRI